MAETRKPYFLLSFANEKVDAHNHLTELEEERKELIDIFSPYKHCGDKFLTEASAEHVLDYLEKHEQELIAFHFSGHASEDSMLMNEKDETREVYSKGIANAIGQLKHIKFVFLNGCSSAGQIRDFHRHGIPVVIASQYLIEDKLAKEFAVTFYKELLTKGKSLREAFHKAEILAASKFTNSTMARDFKPKGKKAAKTPYVLKEHPNFPGIADQKMVDWKEELGKHKTSYTLKGGKKSYLLCNRSLASQSFDISALKEKKEVYSPSCYIIHGPEEEKPDLLAERFCIFNLPALMKKTGFEQQKVDSFVLPGFPDKRMLDSDKGDLIRPLQVIKHNLAVSMQFSDLPELDGKSISRRLEQNSNLKVVVITHLISKEKHYHPLFKELLQVYLSKVWQIETLRSAVKLILLFQVTYPKKKGFLSFIPITPIAMEEDINSLASELPNCMVLEKLEKVPLSDVEMWQRLVMPDLSMGQEEQIKKLYQQYRNKAVPMKEVVRVLKLTVERLYESRKIA